MQPIEIIFEAGDAKTVTEKGQIYNCIHAL